MFIPKLKYLFFIERERSIWTQRELIGYLNSRGIKPGYITQASLSSTIIERYYDADNFPKVENFDILFSETYGIWPASKIVLEHSKNAGVTNLVIGNFPTINNLKPTFKGHYPPQNTTLVDGICLIDKRTEKCMNEINPNLDTLVTGNPEWDIIKTQKFKEEAESVKQKYGNNLLLLCAGPFDHFQKEQEQYYKWIIDKAEEQDFNVIVNLHAETEDAPEYFRGYINTVSHRYANLIAASHIITRVASGMTQESLLFGKNVASNPFLFLGEQDTETGLFHKWIEDNVTWEKETSPRIGEDLFNMIPLINNKQSLTDFLSSDKLRYSEKDIDNIFGMPKVESYKEHFFETVEKYMEDKKFRKEELKL